MYQDVNFHFCLSCGKNDHKKDSCKLRNDVCHRCKKRGHIASVCKFEIHSMHVGDEDELVSTHTIHCHHTIEDDEDSNFVHLDVTLNNVTVKAELDTAAGRSIIGLHIWRKLGRPGIFKKDHRIKGFGNNNFVPALGFTRVKLRYKLKEVFAVFIVVNENCESFKIHSFVHDSYESIKQENVQEQFKSIFEPGLGHCSIVKAHIL